MHLLNKTKNNSYHVVSSMNFKYNSCMLFMHGRDICVSELCISNGFRVVTFSNKI